ncbi:tetratricopeptide repeat protein 36 isoform X1 [Pogoniulus pusillus]|uniref:tetratricopeptide repeat protein 36 isoform X1 n=1 Tax=Pogoniulus pusillus TaxID=488313 RepID=UPI0030B949DD
MATANDRAVLQTIFNPSTPFGDIPGLDEEGEDDEDAQGDGDAFPEELLEQVRDLELQGVTAAESGDVSTALERFGEAVRLLPERASGYNNRAQALRLRGDVAGEQRRGGGRPLATPARPNASLPPARRPEGPGRRHPPEQGPRPRRLPELRAARPHPPAAGPRRGGAAGPGAGGAAGQRLRPAAAGAAQPLLGALQPDALRDAGTAAQSRPHRQRVRRLQRRSRRGPAGHVPTAVSRIEDPAESPPPPG